MATKYFKRLHKAQNHWAKHQNQANTKIALALLRHYAKPGGERFIKGNWRRHHVRAVNEAIDKFNRIPPLNQNVSTLLIELGKALSGAKINSDGSLAAVVQTIVSQGHPNYFARKDMDKLFGKAVSVDHAYQALKRYSANALVRWLRGESKNDHVKLVRRALKAYRNSKANNVHALLQAVRAELQQNNLQLSQGSPLKALLDEVTTLAKSNFNPNHRPNRRPHPQPMPASAQGQAGQAQPQPAPQVTPVVPQASTVPTPAGPHQAPVSPPPQRQQPQFNPAYYPPLDATQISINGKPYTKLPSGAYDNITTDHGWQMAQVDLQPNVTQPALTINGATWNMMNFGFASNGQYSNNPWHKDETPNDYLQRKRAQIAEVRVNILPHVDFLFLQEPDFIVDNFHSGNKNAQLARGQGVVQHLRQQFNNLMRTQDFIAVASPKWSRNNLYNYKPNVICYNIQVLTPVNNSFYGLFADRKDVYHGLAMDFTLNTDPTVVITLVSLHMDYTLDNNADYKAFLDSQAASGKFTVMAGDTNHPASMEDGFKTGADAYPTAFDDDKTDPTKFTTIDERNGSAKTYDGFISWPKQQSSIRTRVTKARFFKVENEAVERCVFDPVNKSSRYN